MARVSPATVSISVMALLAPRLAAAPTEPLPAIAEMVQGLEKHEGLLSFHLDRQRGTMWLEVPPAPKGGEGHEMLYVEGLLVGLGSNPVGLDRGQLGNARLVVLRRAGGKLLVEEINTSFRASTDNPDERRAVRESFARSVLWGGPVAAEDGDGTYLVDFTSFIVRDAHGSARTLADTGQGSFALDADRSAIDPGACLAFPGNLEFEATLTFAGDKPGAHVRSTAPEPHAVTVVQHHSLLRLPDDGYTPRRFDPREGSFAVSFLDYAAPLDTPIEKLWIVRHRLEKKNPRAERSEVVEPIVYYVDPGAPEPVRSALVEGARWWAEAFEEAGFIDAFRVEILPEGAHPLDARYNVIQWVHRSTRGWSYGGGVIDPRTGEMIKGHVSLGSLRVRHDRLIFEGLAGTGATGGGGPDDPVQLALARIRQLSAHEVGHTLGLTHNFAASTYGRASVMDYPAPLVRVTGSGTLDLSDAYSTGVGAWDRHAIRYAYSQFAPGADEEKQLEAITRDGIERGLLFLTDHDARPAGAANPLANLWDNGPDPVEELARVLEVRRVALEGFGERAIAPGRPLALLQETLVPIYLYHRYQIEAAAKVIGGLDYVYAVRGDGQDPARMLDPDRQREALAAILDCLDPAALDLPEALLERLLPRPFGYETSGELFNGRAGPVFDPLGAAETAASMAVGVILQPERAARLIDFNRRDPGQPGLEEVLDRLTAAAFDGVEETPRLAELARVVQRAVVNGLIDLASDPGATSGTRARVDRSLVRLRDRLTRTARVDETERAHRDLLAGDIARYLDRSGPETPERPRSPQPPPGSPIGS